MAEPAAELVSLAGRFGTGLRQADRGEQASAVIPATDIIAVLGELKEQGFTMLSDLTAVDWLGKGRDHRFEIVYQLQHMAEFRRIRLVSPVAADESHPTAKGVYPAAGYPEREVWDQFGITFEGHGDIRRLINPDDFEGHPLRKDFPLRGRGYRDDFPNYNRDLLEKES